MLPLNTPPSKLQGFLTIVHICVNIVFVFLCSYHVIFQGITEPSSSAEGLDHAMLKMRRLISSQHYIFEWT